MDILDSQKYTNKWNVLAKHAISGGGGVPKKRIILLYK